MSLEFFGHTHASFLTKFLLTCYNRILVKHFLPASVKVVMARDRGSRLYFKVSFKRGGSKKFLSEQGVLANTIVLVDKGQGSISALLSVGWQGQTNSK